jgi:hypothetical protein
MLLLPTQEKQAEKQKAAEPRPLTETQLAWQKMQQERAEVQQPARAMQQAVGVVAQPPAAVPVTPVYTITWQVRLSSLGNIPLPWAEAN